MASVEVAAERDRALTHARNPAAGTMEWLPDVSASGGTCVARRRSIVLYLQAETVFVVVQADGRGRPRRVTGDWWRITSSTRSAISAEVSTPPPMRATSLSPAASRAAAIAFAIPAVTRLCVSLISGAGRWLSTNSRAVGCGLPPPKWEECSYVVRPATAAPTLAARASKNRALGSLSRNPPNTWLGVSPSKYQSKSIPASTNAPAPATSAHHHHPSGRSQRAGTLHHA